MPQETGGIRAVLSLPAAYDALQDLLGANRARSEFISTYLRPVRGQRVLDVGCGTAAILDHLPDVAYYGFDISDLYIAAARARYGDRGTFFPQRLTREALAPLPQFDLVCAFGLLHHLDDAEAADLLQTCSSALAPDGRFVSLDNCITPDQSLVARFLISRDRGRNVRDEAGYAAIAATAFASVETHIRRDLLRVPYTHIILECA